MKINQIRIRSLKTFHIEIVYSISIKKVLRYKITYMSIDLGLDNLNYCYKYRLLQPLLSTVRSLKQQSILHKENLSLSEYC